MPNNNESPWVERVALPLVVAFVLGVVVTDIVRDAERAVASVACTTEARR